jgi:hypothetical protein
MWLNPCKFVFWLVSRGPFQPFFVFRFL